MIFFAFVCLGFLIGNLVGMSAESTLGVIIPLLFAFGGGSAVAFLHKLDAGERRLAAAAVVAFSLSCLAGVHVGIVVSEYRLLSPAGEASEARVSIARNKYVSPDNKYLRAVDISEMNLIDQRYKSGEYTAEQAYEEIYELISPGELHLINERYESGESTVEEAYEEIYKLILPGGEP